MMTEQENKADERWCENGEDRYGEYGVIGAEQADESHYDDRLREEDGDDEDDFGGDGRVHFAKKKLYGREEELAQCRELFDSNEASAVFVSGYSGSGKSRVVEEFMLLNSTLTDDKQPSIIFLRSKSEAIQASAPFSSISGLFDNTDHSVIHELIEMRDEIQETLGNDARLLLKVFPKLDKFLGSDAGIHSLKTSSSASDSLSVSFATATTTTGSSGIISSAKKDTKRRMMFALQVLFRTLSSRSNRRLCVFVDDLQWVDLLTMELIESILTDDTINNLFFFGGYRSNEVDEDHILVKKMQSIKEKREEKGLKGYLGIELKDLHKEAIGEFIADSLRLSFEEALPLTNAVFAKTLGNPFFTRQALQHLVLKNALYYDTISFRWDWKLQEKELKDLISDDLLEMIKVKIKHLEPKLQEVLMTASCTRSTFDVDTILFLLNPKLLKQSRALVDGANATEEEYEEEKLDLIRILNDAVVEGLLVQPEVAKQPSNLRQSITAANAHEATGEEYAFAHDKIQETARSLISSGPNEFEFLERIGSVLSQMARSALYGEDWMFFTACEHLNRVSTHYKSMAESENQEEPKPDFMDKEKHFDLSVLNLRTAELSIDLHAFPATLEFCKHGISYLPADEDERWSEKYHDTTLHLFSIAAQATLGIGDMDETERYCNLVMSQNSGVKPKVTTIEAIPVFLVYLDIAMQKGEMTTALELNLRILRELGIRAPKNERMLRAKVWWNLKKVKRRLPSEDSIQHMPHVMDPIVAYKIELMKNAASLAYSTKATSLYALLNCKSAMYISKHGLTESSAASIASFSNVLMHVYNDFKTSPKVAELAILIADREQNKFSETHPLNTANHNVLGWIRPISSRIKYHERAYKSGITSGNIVGAMLSKGLFLLGKLWSCCITLPKLEEEYRAAITEMRKMGQAFSAGIHGGAWQLTLNLVGKSGNPNTTILTGEATDESDEFLQKMPQKVFITPYKSLAFLFFGDFEAGAEDALKRGDEFPNVFVGFMYGFESVIRAIPLLIMARSDNPQKSKFRKSAMILLKRVRQWVKNGCVNLVGVHQLMEAEYMALKKNGNAARSHFEAAITSCRKDGFHHFAGLTCELYSAYLSEIGDSKGQKIYLQGAIDDYGRWGCKRKVDMLKEKLSE